MPYNSRVYYTGTGSEQNLSVTFPYLDISHVHVYYAGVRQEDTDWSWLNSSTITLTAPAGVEVEIRRSTPIDAPLVDFTNNSLLNEDDQNMATLQSLYLIQEGADVSVLIEETIAVVGDTAIAFSMDNGEVTIDTGTKTHLVIPFDCDIVGAYLLAGATGSMQVDVWVCPYADFPPTDADSIVASAPLVLSDAVKYLDTTLTGWTIRIAAGSVITINVDSCTTITKASVVLKVTRVQV